MTITLPLCKIDDCGVAKFAKGWCKHHYNLNYRYGDPLYVHPQTRVRESYRAVVGPCSLDECDTIDKITRSYCQIHYRAFNRYGDPRASPRPRDLVTRFWMKVDKGDESECWLWTGSQTKNKYSAYGILRNQGRQVSAHRLAFEIANSVKLDSHEPVHHTCGNTLCVNPLHLQAITQAENTAEMLERQFYKKRILELEQEVAQLKEQLSQQQKTNDER